MTTKVYKTAAAATAAAEKIAKNHPNVECTWVAALGGFAPHINLRPDQDWMAISLKALAVSYKIKPTKIPTLHDPAVDFSLMMRWEPDARRHAHGVVLHIGKLKTPTASVSYTSLSTPEERKAGKHYLVGVDLPGYRHKERGIMLVESEEAGKALAEKMVRRWLEWALAPAPVTK